MLKLIVVAILVTSQAFASDFEGTWDKICVRGVQRTEIVQANKATLQEIFYSDKFCQAEPVFSFASQGSFTTPMKEHIDFTFEKVFVTVFNEKTTADYNARAVCGRTDWRIAEPQEVTGLKCALFGSGASMRIPAAGRMVYGIWRVESDKLFLGDITRERDGSTPAKRPREFDPVPYVKRH